MSGKKLFRDFDFTGGDALRNVPKQGFKAG
jgi:hypothetical protein